MRIAIITWPTLDDDYTTHIIAGNNRTDLQLSQMARRWAAIGLSARAYKACTIALYTADLTNPKRVKDTE